MKIFCYSVAFILMIFTILVSRLNADQKSVLASLEMIKASVESGVGYQRYIDLLADCKVEINLLYRTKNKNECFIKKVQRCFSKYEKAGGRWGAKNRFEADREREIMERNAAKDMELFNDHNGNINLDEEIIIDLQKEMQNDWAEGARYLDEAYKCLN